MQAPATVRVIGREGAGVAAPRARRVLDPDHVHAGVREELTGDLTAIADLHRRQPCERSRHQTAPSATSVSNSASL